LAGISVTSLLLTLYSTDSEGLDIDRSVVSKHCFNITVHITRRRRKVSQHLQRELKGFKGIKALKFTYNLLVLPEKEA